MAGSGGSPDADDPSCGGDGAEPSRTLQESDGRYSAPASPLSTRPSGQPPGTSVVANEGSASSSAWGSDDDDEPTDRYKNPAAASFLLGPSSSTMGASSSSSSFSSDSWIGSDRTRGGASTSSSLDASNYMDFYRDPPSEWMYNQVLQEIQCVLDLKNYLCRCFDQERLNLQFGNYLCGCFDEERLILNLCI